MFATYQRGTKFPKNQRTVYDYDPTRGWNYQYYFEGLDQNILKSLQNDFVRGGIACRLTLYKGKGDLEANDSTQQYTIDVWQLLGNDERLDLFNHPNIAKYCTADQITVLRQHLDAIDKPSSAFQDPELSSLAGGVIQRLYELYQKGTTEFENDAYGGGYVLRHTTNASNRWNQNIADIGAGMLYSTAQLLTETRSSYYWNFPLPNRLAYKIANIREPDYKENFLWSWKKGRSTETTAANNRIDIATEYTLEQWSTDLYTEYVRYYGT